MEFYEEEKVINGVVYRTAIPDDYTGVGVMVAEGAKIGRNVRIGDCCTILRGATIENFAVIGRNVDIGEYARIGVFADIGAHASIEKECDIGMYSIVGSRAHIGMRSDLASNSRIPCRCHIGPFAEIHNRELVDLLHLENIGLDRDTLTFWRLHGGGIMVNSAFFKGVFDRFCELAEEVEPYLTREAYRAAIHLAKVQMIGYTGGNGE